MSPPKIARYGIQLDSNKNRTLVNFWNLASQEQKS